MSNRRKFKVLVIGHLPNYEALFETQDTLEITHDFEEADLVCFTGGADVDPKLYGHELHNATYMNQERDHKEVEIFKNCIKADKSMVGICRGAQFLHAMCGGTLFQDVDNHAIHRTHVAWEVSTGKEFGVTSTHHQMLKHDKGRLMAYAQDSNRREQAHDGFISIDNGGCDVESIYHEEQSVMCFQPHPEFHGAESTRELFWSIFQDTIALDMLVKQRGIEILAARG